MKLIGIAIVLLCVSATATAAMHASTPDICDQVRSLGYQCEHHSVPTEDGFVLGALRIPPKSAGAPVAFLQHGLLDSAVTWVMNYFPQQNLACILHDLGYDVWMGNSRGNVYSLVNTQHSVDTDAFWNAVDMDQMAKYDLPANIDYVLAVTGRQTLSWIGHSQGTWQAFSAFSTVRKEYASKVNVFAALAPVAFVAHQNSILLSILVDLDIPQIVELFGVRQFLPTSWLIHLISAACSDRGINCDDVVAVLCGGGNMTNLNETQVHTLTRYDPGGTSVINLIHWAQEVMYGTYEMHDWGADNQRIYGQPTPPKYNLTEYAGPPLGLFWGGQDDLADPQDVATIASSIPSEHIVGSFGVPNYGHLDFVWGVNANVDVYPEIIKLLAKYNPL